MKMLLARAGRAAASLLLTISVVACGSEPAWPAPPPGNPAELSEQEGHARNAHLALLQAPDEEERIIWYGRRLAYLGRYEDAVTVYTRGLEEHPASAKLLRHRGHRYISLRRFGEARRDFERAVELLENIPDEVEPDGLPNARNQPTSTLHTNVWYHLGLTQYCQGEFAAAARSYEACLAAAKNPDMECAARYWLYLSARRAGDWERAGRVVEPVKKDWDVIENHAYHRLLLLFRGELDEEAVASAGDDAIQDATLAYGLARWRIFQQDPVEGERRLRALAETAGAAFGCIAAEADVAALEAR